MARALSASLGEIGGRLAAEELMLCLFWEKVTNLSHFEAPGQDVGLSGTYGAIVLLSCPLFTQPSVNRCIKDT